VLCNCCYDMHNIDYQEVKNNLSPSSKHALNIKKILGLVLLVLVCEFCLFRWWFTPFIISGDSMFPTLKPNNHYYVNRLAFTFDSPARGDIVIVRDVDGELIVKRVVALPGETLEIKNDAVFINGVRLPEPYIKARWDGWIFAPTVLRKQSYFLIGDNRFKSQNQFVYGIYQERDFVGKLLE